MFWILIIAAASVVIILIANGDRGSILGLEPAQFATLSIMSLWAIFIGTGFFGGGSRLGEIFRNLAIWSLIIVMLMAGYVFRFELQDVGSRLSGGIIPGSPISTSTALGEQEVTLIRSQNGHFEANVTLNNAPARFLIDTGATSVVLTHQDAQSAGIEVDQLSFNSVHRTANGLGRFARATIDRFQLGGISRENMPVFVAKPELLSTSLLGQTFLESLKSYERRGDRLMLRD